jgi:maleylacetate reductase
MPTTYFAAWQDRIIDDPAPAAIAKELERRGASRAYFLMPEPIHKDPVFFGALEEALGDRIAGVYDSLPAHSPLPDVFGAAREARDAGADLIVSIGGGSNIDAAKMVQFALAVGAFEMDEVLAARKDSGRHFPSKVRNICVPTTLSGAEFTYFAGGRNPRTMLKEPFSVPGILPATLILDQKLASSTPQALWLSSGLRAMDHAVEALSNPRMHPMGEVLAVEGMARLHKGLTITHGDPADLEARRTSQYGGWFAAIGLMSGVPMGISHAIGHVIGSVFDVPHGFTSCIALPSVMAYNYDAVPREKYEAMAKAFGGTEAHEAPDLLRKFISDLGLPTTMGDVGLDRSSFDAIAKGTMHEGWAKTNVRPVRGEEDVISILEMML